MTDKLDEKLDPSQGAGEYIKDFQKSDAPQFKGKSQEKRKVMALAAYLDAKRDMKEAVQKADVPAYLRKQKGEAPLTLKDLKRKDTISDKENLAKLRNEEVELDEANHREFASQGKMHPDMAKHMKTGEHMDYYEPKTGDKVHGKVIKNDGKEVHVKQTHDSYDSKKVGTVHKFTIASKLEEGRMKDIATNAQETERLKKKDDVPFDGPYTKTKANVKDKSGAVHSAFSRAKHLARQAMNNVKEETEQLDELSSNTLRSYVQGAKDDVQNAKDERDSARSGGDGKGANDAYQRQKKRTSGIKQAKAKLNKEEVEQVEEQAPVAPVPDKKYIKGTPEHKAYKATKKPINGHPTNVKEELKGNQHKLDKNKNGKLDKQDFKLLRKEDFENGEIETMSKSYKQFVEELNEIKMSDLPSRKVSGRSYGAQYHDPEGDDDADDKPKAKPAADQQKRGRGRPAGSKSGARQIGSAAKKRSGVEYTGYPLHLPNKN